MSWKKYPTGKEIEQDTTKERQCSSQKQKGKKKRKYERKFQLITRGFFSLSIETLLKKKYTQVCL